MPASDIGVDQIDILMQCQALIRVRSTGNSFPYITYRYVTISKQLQRDLEEAARFLKFEFYDTLRKNWPIIGSN